MRLRLIAIVIAVLVIIGGVFQFVRSRHHADPAHTPATSHTAPASTAPSNTSKKNTSAAAGFNKQRYSLSTPTSRWVVVNKQRPLSPKTYAPNDLTSIGGGQYMRAEAAHALQRMISAAAAAGYKLTPASGYRSYATQTKAYDSELRAYGRATADSESARPGYSEHQTGWAVDLASGGCSVQDCFGTTPGGTWAIANAYRYGFLLRYPPDKVDVTGYRHESWHFRYIGTDLSTELHTKHIKTLEEFFGLPAAPSYK